jgi:hypothetical protein
MIMKTLMSALVALAMLAGIAATASAADSDGLDASGSAHCPAGYSNVLGACFNS